MPRACTICSHAQRAEIDAALVAGQTPNTALSSLFGVTESAIRRHARDHLPAKLAQAQEAQEIAQADDLLSQVRRLQVITMNCLRLAYEAKDLRTALQGVAQARGNLELLARLLGELHDQEIKVAVLVTSPDWLRLRGAILTALEPWPDARLAVAEAIR